MTTSELKDCADGIAHACKEANNPLAKTLFEANYMITQGLRTEEKDVFLSYLKNSLRETFFPNMQK